jgi:predicted RNase H-like nuclease (RuvC/YqgF family)
MPEKEAGVPEGTHAFDAGTLMRENEKYIAVVNELSTRFAALNFKAYEMAEEIRNLEMRLSGTQATLRCIEWENDQLRAETRLLRKVLLEFSNPPTEVRQLVESYRKELSAREMVPDRKKE